MGTVFGSIELSKLDHWNLEFGGRNREIEMEPWIWSNPEHHCIEACRHGPCSTFFSEPCSAPLYVVVTRKHKVWYASSWLLLQMMNLPSLSPTFSQRQRHFEANNHHIFFIQISVLSPLSSPIFGPNVHQHLRVTASWAASFAVTGSCSPAISAAADPPMVSSLRSRTRSCQRAKGGKPGGATGRGTAPFTGLCSLTRTCQGQRFLYHPTPYVVGCQDEFGERLRGADG